jgi:hypothetical protein
LKGFKKGRGDTVTLVQEFVMPPFKMDNNKIKVINTVSSSPQPSTPINAVSQVNTSRNSILAEISACLDLLEAHEKENSVNISNVPVTPRPSDNNILYGVSSSYSFG